MADGLHIGAIGTISK